MSHGRASAGAEGIRVSPKTCVAVAQKEAKRSFFESSCSKELVLVRSARRTHGPGLRTSSSLNWISWDIRGMERPVTRIKPEPEPDSFKQMLGFSRRIFLCLTLCFPIRKRNICSKAFVVLRSWDGMGLSLPGAIGHQARLLGEKVTPGVLQPWVDPLEQITGSIDPSRLQLDKNSELRVALHGKWVLLDFICPLEHFYRRCV